MKVNIQPNNKALHPAFNANISHNDILSLEKISAGLFIKTKKINKTPQNNILLFPNAFKAHTREDFITRIHEKNKFIHVGDDTGKLT